MEPELHKAMVLLLARCWDYKLKTEDGAFSGSVSYVIVRFTLSHRCSSDSAGTHSG